MNTEINDELLAELNIAISERPQAEQSLRNLFELCKGKSAPVETFALSAYALKDKFLMEEFVDLLIAKHSKSAEAIGLDVPPMLIDLLKSVAIETFSASLNLHVSRLAMMDAAALSGKNPFSLVSEFDRQDEESKKYMRRLCQEQGRGF